VVAVFTKWMLFKDVAEVSYHTFGAPSDALILGTLAGTRVAFLASRSQSHFALRLPFRANIYAMKQLGVEYLISASAVGSLRKLNPGYGCTNLLTGQNQFPPFGEGLVAHIAFADPVCNQLAGILADAIANLNLPEVTSQRWYIRLHGRSSIFY